MKETDLISVELIALVNDWETVLSKLPEEIISQDI
jgi:hypothetical protein